MKWWMQLQRTCRCLRKDLQPKEWLGKSCDEILTPMPRQVNLTWGRVQYSTVAVSIADPMYVRSRHSVFDELNENIKLRIWVWCLGFLPIQNFKNCPSITWVSPTYNLDMNFQFDLYYFRIFLYIFKYTDAEQLPLIVYEFDFHIWYFNAND